MAEVALRDRCDWHRAVVAVVGRARDSGLDRGEPGDGGDGRCCVDGLGLDQGIDGVVETLAFVSGKFAKDVGELGGNVFFVVGVVPACGDGGVVDVEPSEEPGQGVIREIVVEEALLDPGAVDHQNGLEP